MDGGGAGGGKQSAQIPVREFTALTSPPIFAARSTASVSCRPARTAASKDVSPPRLQFSSQLDKSFLYSKLVFEQLTARSTRDVGMQELEVNNNSRDNSHMASNSNYRAAI